MKKMFLILTVLLLTLLMTTCLAEAVSDPAMGKPLTVMPDNESFDAPATLVPGTFYAGEAHKKYQLVFTPPVSGTYTVYGKTEGEYNLRFEITDEYKNPIGWSFDNRGTRTPCERNVELEAGKTYHFYGTGNSNWTGSGPFVMAVYPADYSTGVVGMPAMESFENPCRIRPGVTYRGSSSIKYQLVFTPEISGTYLVYAEADDTSGLSFQILDRNKQAIGWTFHNDNLMGPFYQAVEMTAGEEYHFQGGRNSGVHNWATCNFSFSLSYVDENETEQYMSAMTDFSYPAHLKENVIYRGKERIAYKQVFTPEKDGMYTITVTTDDKTDVKFKVVDQYQQDFGWSLNNGGIMGTTVQNIVLRAGTEYGFTGTANNQYWGFGGSFTFSIAPAEGDTADLLPAMSLFANPGTIESGILYHGNAGNPYELVFVPEESGTYFVHAKTQEPEEFRIRMLDEYQQATDWELRNNGNQMPVVSSLELEAGREYHFSGALSSKAVWSNSPFEFSICAPSAHAGELSEYQTILEPTCTESGFSAQVCTLCQQPVNSQEIPATGHTPGEPLVYQEPGCETAGIRVTLCSVCGAEIAREEIPATGHIPGEPVVYQHATCLTAGLKVTLCTACGAEIAQEEIPTTGHQPGVWEDLKPVTCTSDGIRVQRCSVCGETLNTENISAFGHSPMDWQITREATCLQSGLREKICSICGVSLEQEEIPALGHSYTEWETTIEPTKETEGERTRHCIHCGDTQQEAIEKVGKFLGIF